MQPELNLSARRPLAPSLHSSLLQRGFTFNGSGYSREALRFAASGRWLVLADEMKARQEELGASSAERRGALWKWVQNGAPAHWQFEIPTWAVRANEEPDRLEMDDLSRLEPLLDWALEARAGSVPHGWVPPARDLVETWLPPGALTVQTDGLVRQAELVLRPDCWALRIPLLSVLLGDLPEERRLALKELVRDAQSLWAMIRFTTETEAGEPSLVLEVDFTGAPHTEALFLAGLDVLRHAAAHLLETAVVLADVSVTLESLSVGRNPQTPNER